MPHTFRDEGENCPHVHDSTGPWYSGTQARKHEGILLTNLSVPIIILLFIDFTKTKLFLFLDAKYL